MDVAGFRSEVLQALTEGRAERAFDVVRRASSDPHFGVQWEARGLLKEVGSRLHPAARTKERIDWSLREGHGLGAWQTEIGVCAFPVAAPGDRLAVGGCFAEVRVTCTDGVDSLPEMAEEAQKAVRDALTAVRKRCPDFVGGFAVAISSPLAWEGGSCGLAVAVAAISALRGRPVDPYFCFSGRVSEGGGLEAVGLIEEKAALVAAARPLGVLLVAAPETKTVGVRMRLVAQLGEAADICLGGPSGEMEASPELSFGEVFRLDRSGDWRGAAIRARALVSDPSWDSNELAQLVLILLVAANHGADVAEQEEWGGRLEDLVIGELRHGDSRLPARAPLSGQPLARALGTRAVAAIDRFDLPGARSLLELSRRLQFDPAHQVHIRGPMAMLATMEGRFESAYELRRENLRHAASSERPRCLGDLADSELRLGRLADAADHLQLAFKELEDAKRGSPASAALPFLMLQRARLYRLQGKVDLAHAEYRRLEHGVGLDPALRARLELAELDGPPFGVAVPFESPIISALFERTRGRMGDAKAAETLCGRFSVDSFEEACSRLPY